MGMGMGMGMGMDSQSIKNKILVCAREDHSLSSVARSPALQSPQRILMI